MIIKDILYDNNGIARATIQGSSDEYITCIDLELSRGWCSCPRYVFTNIPCKHILNLYNRLDKDKMTKKESEAFLDTGSEVINNLLGGGVPYGIVTATFGEPTAGKSWFSYQCGLANIAQTGKKTILIETEGLRDYDIKLILYKLMKRYNLDKKTVDDNFIIMHTLGDTQLQSVQKLMQMFGFMVTYEISKGGKYSVKFQPCGATIKDPLLKQTSMIILDSLTKPIKDSVGSETQNLPARAQVVERLFGKLYHNAMIYNLAILVTHHASINPSMPFGRDLGKPYGGNPILYNSKYAMEFIDAPNKVKTETGWGEESRRVMLLRRPDEQTTKELIPVRLKKDYGFCDE